MNIDLHVGSKGVHVQFAGEDQFGSAFPLTNLTVALDSAVATFVADPDNHGGVVLGVAPGTTTLTVSEGNVSASATVTVVAAVEVPVLSKIVITADAEVG